MSWAITGATRLAAVIGSPVRHSLSPALHNAVFEAARLDWRFVAFEVAPGRAGEAVAAMKLLGIAGFAVTMPHKADVAAAVDEVDQASAALGSVNTVVLRPDGSTFGASTDGAGFVDSVTAAGFRIPASRVVVLGAGGAARSIVDALGHGRVSPTSQSSTAHRPAPSLRRSLCDVARVGTSADIGDADLLVNATSIGMGTRRATDRSDVVAGRPGRGRHRLPPAADGLLDRRRRRSAH